MLDGILELSIITTEGMSQDESLKLIEQLECAELALSQFVKGGISFNDYVDILKLCNVDIEDYFIQVESNLTAVGITV